MGGVGLSRGGGSAGGAGGGLGTLGTVHLLTVERQAYTRQPPLSTLHPQSVMGLPRSIPVTAWSQAVPRRACLDERATREGRMTRHQALNAALSPREESALRRVQAGISMPNFLPAGEVERLKKLQLVEERDGRIHLTPEGSTRAEALARG